VARELAPTPDRSAIAALREVFAGEIVLPDDPAYDAGRIVWNAMIDRYPAIIVRPTGAADVISAVRFARAQRVPVAVRGGGHSIAGFATCNGGIVIDLSRMQGVRVDPDRRMAWTTGGAHLSELDHEAQAFGLACPVGVVGHTGVAGLTLGGGMGRLQRKLGLTIDNLMAVDVVTADGRLVRASEEEEPELFWGLRGAGPNFGIATSFQFRLHEVGPMVMQGSIVHPIDRAREVAALFGELVETTPDEVFPTFGVAFALPEEAFPPEVAGRPIVTIGVTHCGELEAAERDLASLRAFGPPSLDTIATRTYLSVQHLLDEAMGWGHRFYWKSGYMASLADEVVDICVDRVSGAPEGCSFSLWGMGRAIARVDEAATAFTGRGAGLWTSVEALWHDASLDDAHLAWAREAWAALQPHTQAGHYVNDMAESGDGVVRSIYGNAKYERLVALKRAWDPDNVFRLNQNVRP
jgi:FAD/FMN-containing dehydrogenase